MWRAARWHYAGASELTMTERASSTTPRIGGGGGGDNDDPAAASTEAWPSPPECQGREGDVIERGATKFAIAHDDESPAAIAQRFAVDVAVLVALNAPWFPRFTRNARLKPGTPVLLPARSVVRQPPGIPGGISFKYGFVRPRGPRTAAERAQQRKLARGAWLLREDEPTASDSDDDRPIMNGSSSRLRAHADGASDGGGCAGRADSSPRRVKAHLLAYALPNFTPVTVGIWSGMTRAYNAPKREYRVEWQYRVECGQDTDASSEWVSAHDVSVPAAGTLRRDYGETTKTYYAHSGETPAAIAQRFAVDVAALIALNESWFGGALQANTPLPGHARICVPTAARGAPATRRRGHSQELAGTREVPTSKRPRLAEPAGAGVINLALDGDDSCSGGGDDDDDGDDDEMLPPTVEEMTDALAAAFTKTEESSFCLGVKSLGGLAVSSETAGHAALARGLNKMLRARHPTAIVTSIQVSKNLSKGAHLDRLNAGPSYLATFGDFEGGGLEILNAATHAVETVDVRADDGKPFFSFNAAQQMHMPEPIRKGVRYSAAFYAHSTIDHHFSKNERDLLRKLGFVVPMHHDAQKQRFTGFQAEKAKEAERRMRSARREWTARSKNLAHDGALAAVPPQP